MINLHPKHYEIIRNILFKYPLKFHVFGSRVKGNNKEYSDLDLFFKGKMGAKQLAKLAEELEESDLPFKVDIVDYRNCAQEFQEILDKESVIFE